VLAVLVLLATTVLGALAPARAAEQDRSSRTRTPIKHFVTLMQENHSFDNYFGTYPGADGIPEDTCLPSGTDAPCVEPWRIGGSAIEDLGHSASVYREQYARGHMDGFVRAFADGRMTNPRLPMGHYDGRDIPFYWNIADEYVLFDRNFTSANAGSIANHMFWVTGTAGGAQESIPDKGFTVPTIFDRLEQAGISWKFYIENYDPSVTFRSRGTSDRGSQVIWCPLLAYARFLDDPALNRHIVPIDQFFTDLDDDDLPAVSYVVPAGSSEHPPGSIAAGEAYVANLISGLMRSDAWSSSAFMWTYDDWGGWYDHVEPPQMDEHGLGFRAPALLVSPYARRGFVDSTTVDFTSQLKFIESNWGVRPLASRDAAANGLDSAFDFESAPRAPLFVSRERSGPPPPVTGQGLVYGTYAVGVLVPSLVLGAAFRRRPGRRRPGRRGPGGGR
jgi:phospholipase C